MSLPGSDNAPLWLNAVVFCAAAIVVWISGTRLTHILDAVSAKTGLDQAFVGMLLLGGITSLPEIANVTSASASGVPHLAINNLLGSAAINVFLLAAADAVIGARAITSIVAKPVTMMMCTLCMLVLCTVTIAIATGDVTVFGVGVWSVVICTLSIVFFGLAASYGNRSSWTIKGPEESAESDSIASSEASLGRLISATVIAGAIIFGAGFTLSKMGDAIAAQTGLGTSLVGFLLIGMSTSTPELSSIVAALRIGRYELAFGQVLGTNFVNLSLFLLADVIYPKGPIINELGRFETISALLGLALIGIFLVGLLERRDPKIMRMGYDSLAVIVTFAAGVVLLYFVS
jgi:cation:H+ antiporter